MNLALKSSEKNKKTIYRELKESKIRHLNLPVLLIQRDKNLHWKQPALAIEITPESSKHWSLKVARKQAGIGHWRQPVFAAEYIHTCYNSTRLPLVHKGLDEKMSLQRLTWRSSIRNCSQLFGTTNDVASSVDLRAQFGSTPIRRVLQ